MNLAVILLVTVGLLLTAAAALRANEWRAGRSALDAQADRDATEFLAILHGPVKLRPHGLLILDEAPWEQTRLILKGEVEHLPETSWGRAQYSNFLCWRSDMAASITDWREEIAA